MGRNDTDWQRQGCAVCRAAWASGVPGALSYLGVSIELHARLFRCPACEAFWEELERHAHVISAGEAQALLAHGSFSRGPHDPV